MDVFTFKTNPLYMPADLDSDDENFKDYVESKGSKDTNNDDLDLKRINWHLDENYRFQHVQPRQINKPNNAGEAAEIIAENEE